MLDTFSDHAHIWIYGFRRELRPVDKEKVERTLNQFLAGWHAHQVPVKGSFEFLEDRFVALVAEDSISGCSVDSSVAVFKELQQNHHLDALDFDLVYYMEGSKIIALRRDEFRMLIQNDRIKPETIVFDLTLTTLGEFRSGRWKVPFEESWHWRAFKRSA